MNNMCIFDIMGDNYKILSPFNDMKKLKIPRTWFKQNKIEKFKKQFPNTYKMLSYKHKTNNIIGLENFKRLKGSCSVY